MKQAIDVPVRMRDGVRLSTDIRLPDGPGPFPVLVVRTPYSNATFGEPEVSFLRAGWAVIKQDCRGRFDSEGQFRPLRGEDCDGRDTLAWVQRQPWCNGRIGMLGASYNGLTTFAAAWTRPAGLRAIAPSVFAHNNFKDVIYRDGVLNLRLALQWGTSVAGRSVQSHDTTDWDRVLLHLPLSSADAAAGYRLAYWQEWLNHPVYDRYWAESSVETHWKDIDAPGFHVGGWYDFYARGVVCNFTGINRHGGPRARGNQRLVMGPWGHTVNTRSFGQLDFGPQAVVPLDLWRQQWLERWVRGVKNGADREAPVKIFIMGTNTWRDEQSWPPEDAVNQALYLSARSPANSLYGGGLLTPEPGSGAAEDRYVYNPANPVPTLGGCAMSVGGPTDHTPIERRDDVLVYTGPRLREPLEVAGNVRVVLFIASDAVDTDFIARLCDVWPDGRSIILCDGVAAARFREGLDREVMLKPGAVTRLEIDLGPTANVFLRGHRVRLEITSSCFPRLARNLNTGEPAATARKMRRTLQTVYHSRRWPSRLLLPIVSRQVGSQTC